MSRAYILSPPLASQLNPKTSRFEVDKAATLTVESGTPAATLVDFFPWMKYIPTWLPFTNFKRKALVAHEAVDTMFRVPYDLVKKDVVRNTSPLPPLEQLELTQSLLASRNI